MIRLKALLVIVLVFTGTFAFGQKQAWKWYFGQNAGLDFSNFDPVPLIDGRTNSLGGVATVCDTTGQLVFYTDGENIWDSNHSPVNTSNLSGDPRSTQAATIVPDPDIEGRYYVFTTRTFITGDNRNWAGNYYTIEIKPGETGRIISDYSTASGKPGLLENATEKFCAIPYRNPSGKTAYWFLMHEFNTNRFLKVKLDDGVWSDPVFQEIGSIHANDSIDDGTNLGAQGQMKANDPGTKVALAVTGGKFFEVFNFNVQTGILSYPMKIPAGDQGGLNAYKYGAYGVEFSPIINYTYAEVPTIGNFLYGSTRDGAYLYQWNLAETDPLQLIKTGKVLGNNPAVPGGALQIAPNGKIYMAYVGQDYLGVVNFPNRFKPDCKFEEYGAVLINNEDGSGGSSGMGLPSRPAFLKTSEPFLIENTCYGDQTVFTVTNQTGITQSSVTFIITRIGGGMNPVTLRPTVGLYEVKYRLPLAGKYRVLLNLVRSGQVQRFTRDFTVGALPVVKLAEKDTVPLCEGSFIHLDAGVHSFYEWENPDIKVRARDITTGVNDPYDYPVDYRVKVTDNNGCIGWDTVWIKKIRNPRIDSVRSIRAFCGEHDGAAIVYPRGKVDDYEFSWEGYPNERTNRLNGLNGGDYVVHVISKQTLCETIDTIHVDELGGASVKLNYSHKTLCPGVPTTFTVTGSTTFEWIRPQGLVGDSVTLILDRDTIFEVKTISIDEGRICERTLIDTIRVYPINKPELGADLTGCKGDTVFVTAPEDYSGWSWSNGFTGRINPVTEEADPLILFATDHNQCVFTDSLKVHFKPKPAVDLGKDRSICSSAPVMLSGGSGDSYLWSTGETTQEISVSKNDKYWLKITTDGCYLTDTARIRINDPEHLKIDKLEIKDISCFGNEDGEIIVSASGDGLSYLYSIDNGVTYSDSSRFRNLLKGSDYRITVWEDSACRISYPTPVVIREPELISAKTCVNPPSCPECKDGSITVSNIVGGTPPFKVWVNTVETGEEIQDLGPGTYQVHITDKNLCSWNTTVEMVAGTNVHIISSVNQTVCPGTPVNLTVVNGSSVEWINPAGSGGTSVVVYPIHTTTYKAMSTQTDPDGFHCVIIAEYTVQVIPYDKPDLGDDIHACYGDTVELDAGDGYLDWSWNTGASTRKIQIFEPRENIIVSVTDINRCTLADTISVTYSAYPEVDLGSDRSLCTNVPIELSGGTGDTYLWSTGETRQTILASNSGTYTLAITKDRCTRADSVNIKIVNPDLLLIDDIRIKDNTCYQSGDGSIEIVAHGSGNNLIYSIDNGISWQSSSLFTGLDSGDGYLIKVQEDSLCVRPHPEPVAVAQPEPIVINYRLRSPTCLGCSDGQIIVRDISGGTPPYRLTLDGKDQENTMTGLAEGTYLLTAYDSRTCSAALELTIDMNLVVPNVITPNGDNINDLWIIPLLNYYPEGDIRLFNSAGQLVREITFTDGYNKDPWNGKDETDQLVPVGTYYYIIRYNDEVDGPMQLTGYVMVLK